MFILNGGGTQIVNAEAVERFCIVEKADAALIVLSYSSERSPVTLARYRDSQEAREALYGLFAAMSEEQVYFEMAESLGEERVKKDARVKRRGGS